MSLSMKTQKFSRIAILAIMILALLSTTGAAFADGAEMTVNGTAVVSVEPDFAEITSGYSADNRDVRVAQQEAAEKMNAILAALKTLGIEDKDIMTSDFSVDSVYDYGDYSAPKIVGYRVTNNVTIVVRDIANVADVLNACFDAGANQSYGLIFRTSKEGEIYRTALAEAIKVARLKADVMAEASGMTVSKITEINEISHSVIQWTSSAASNVRMDLAGDSKAFGLGDTIMSGALDITARVELHFKADWPK
ncbi:SIMPL domain-containing protein [Clostridia bacterium]|nr:SIMPL domain-containing protein [Clostridia bacterium]